MLQGAGEESAGRRYVPLRGDQHVDDLPELVDRPVQINPPPGDLDVGFVNEPAIPGTCRQAGLRREQGVNRCTHRNTVT